jgi:anti-sigma factor RsiW
MPERRCKQIFAMLSGYLDGELSTKNCRQLERHLQGCQPCIAYLESLRTTVEACRRYRAPQAPAPSQQVRAALLAAAQRVRKSGVDNTALSRGERAEFSQRLEGRKQTPNLRRQLHGG